MTAYQQEFIEFMVRSEVLTFGDFVTKSGRNTPYFINTGNYKTGEQAAKLGEFYANHLHASLSGQPVLFGPAYKGIPLAVACAIAYYKETGISLNYCFNRKEEKDHGEGGSLVGAKLKDGDKVVIIEDVVTAGTALRECMPVLQKAAKVSVAGLIVSVDRMERGKGEKTAISEIADEFGIPTFPIVTTRNIIDYLHNKEVDGKVYINDEVRQKMEDYLSLYCVKQ